MLRDNRRDIFESYGYEDAETETLNQLDRATKECCTMMLAKYVFLEVRLAGHGTGLFMAEPIRKLHDFIESIKSNNDSEALTCSDGIALIERIFRFSLDAQGDAELVRLAANNCFELDDEAVQVIEALLGDTISLEELAVHALSNCEIRDKQAMSLLATLLKTRLESMCDQASLPAGHVNLNIARQLCSGVIALLPGGSVRAR